MKLLGLLSLALVMPAVGADIPMTGGGYDAWAFDIPYFSALEVSGSNGLESAYISYQGLGWCCSGSTLYNEYYGTSAGLGYARIGEFESPWFEYSLPGTLSLFSDWYGTELIASADLWIEGRLRRVLEMSPYGDYYKYSVDVTAAPEPATIGLLAAACVVLGAVGVKRNHEAYRRSL